MLRTQREAGGRPQKQCRGGTNHESKKPQPFRRDPARVRQYIHVFVRHAFSRVMHPPFLLGGIKVGDAIGGNAAIDVRDGGGSGQEDDAGAAKPGVIAPVVDERGAEAEGGEEDGKEDGAAVGHEAAIEVVGAAGEGVLGAGYGFGWVRWVVLMLHHHSLVRSICSICSLSR